MLAEYLLLRRNDRRAIFLKLAVGGNGRVFEVLL